MIKKVLLIGNYPPPIGGVSMHLERFLLEMQNEKYITSLLDIKKRKVFGAESGGFFACINSFISADLIHIHLSTNLKNIIVTLAIILGKKVVYTHHNSRVTDVRNFVKLFNMLDHLILVNDRSIQIDKKILNSQKTSVIPAFLPPKKYNKLDDDLRRIITGIDFLVTTNCSNKSEFNGKDLYGFDIIIAAYAQFCDENKSVNSLLVLVDPSNTSSEFTNNCLRQHNIPISKVIFWGQSVDFYSLMLESNAVIRGTRSDGDSLTVREALYNGTPIIASDCTWRPNGTITYETESSHELFSKLKIVYANKSNLVYKSEDYFYKILNVYDKVIQR